MYIQSFVSLQNCSVFIVYKASSTEQKAKSCVEPRSDYGTWAVGITGLVGVWLVRLDKNWV